MNRIFGTGFVAAMLACGLAGPSNVWARAQPADRATITYTEHIAPIILNNCASCHRPGQAAPFTLLNYDDVRRRAHLIGQAVAARVMPPWMPEPGVGGFVGERRLTDAQVRLIQDWIAQGMTEGDPSMLPGVPAPLEEWQLGTPDLVVSMPAYVLGAYGPDELRNFVVPIPTRERRFVRGIEFRPGNPGVVHHATMRVDQTRASRRLDDEDPQPGYRGILAPDARYPDGHFLAWTPGQLRPLAEDGFSWRLQPDSDLVLQLHLQPSGRPEPVDARIAFFFTDVPPARQPSILRLSRQDLDIPAGDASYVVEDRYVVPVDVEVRELQPHAHLLARRFESVVQFPDGSTRPLLRIADWNFKWQDVYRLQEPLHLPAGSSLVMRVTYDNTPANVRNPSSPPRRVRWGQDTVDEMGDLWLQVRTRSRDDQAVLERDFGKKLITEDIVGHEGMLARDPDNAGLHENLAAYYLQLGEGSKAIDHLEESLRLNPRSSMGRYNLGTALLVLGRREEAIDRFEEAIQLNPDLAYARNSLGYALRTQGKLEEAVEHYRRAVAIDPRYANAHNNLGVALQALGRLDEAAGSFERAALLKPDDPVPRRNWARALVLQGRGPAGVAHLRLAIESAPDWPQLLADLAWVLAVHPDATTREPRESVLLARRAAGLTSNRDPRILDVLSAASAAAGDFETASALARSAMALAVERQDRSAAAAIGQRLHMYDRRSAYVHDFAAGFGR
jgi:tetratricopeptide (TPR) repeat protein